MSKNISENQENFADIEEAFRKLQMINYLNSSESTQMVLAKLDRWHEITRVKILNCLGEKGGKKFDFIRTSIGLGASDSYERLELSTEHYNAYMQALLDSLHEEGIVTAESKISAEASNSTLRIIEIAERKLRKAVRLAPAKEKDIQDAFETLLIGADIQFSREAERVEYSSKTYTPDFTMSNINLAVEIKLCPKADREKEIIAEINDDILAYQTKWQSLLFVVYDLGFIRDIERFVEAFERSSNVMVRVVKQ